MAAITINLGLNEYKALLDLCSLGYTKTLNWLREPTRVEKLSDDVFSSRIKFGKQVTVEGKLSRYGITYRPQTYHQDIGLPIIQRTTFDPTTKILSPSISHYTQPFQYPAQVLPSIEDDVVKYCVAFLYSMDFSSFVMEKTPYQGQSSETNRFIIEARHRPIPVLLPTETLENIAEHEVVITGIVSELPETVIDTVTNSLCPIRESIYYHFLRTASPKAGFCIDCRRKVSSDFSPKNKMSELHGAIYIEGHFEGITDDRYLKEYSDAIPAKGAKTKMEDVKNQTMLYLNTDPDVSLIRAGPNTFGFYTQGDLLDPRDYDRKLLSLKRFYHKFRRNVRNNISKHSSFEAQFRPDFLFDYRKQYAFHRDGVLSSKSAEQTLHEHPELKETAEWLKNP